MENKRINEQTEDDNGDNANNVLAYVKTNKQKNSDNVAAPVHLGTEERMLEI